MNHVTPADIQSAISSENYFTAADGVRGAPGGDNYLLAEYVTYDGGPLSLLTFCVIVTTNGHTVTGESHCQDPAKFDAQIGREEARKDAINKLWPMVVYAARSAPAEWPEPSGRVLTEADSMADLHGYARPDNPTV